MNTLKKFFLLSAAFAVFSSANVFAQSFTPRSASADRSIEQRVYKEIITLPRYGVFDFIQFKVEGSTVILDGKTISLGTRSQAANAVKRIPGVSNVINNIEELPLSSFDNAIRRQTLRLFVDRSLGRYLHELRPDVRIIVDSGRVTLEGYVSNASDRNLMNILAHSASGTFHVENNLRVGKDLMR